MGGCIQAVGRRFHNKQGVGVSPKRMKVIYEVPLTFRITLVRDFSAGVGSSHVIKRPTPFILHLRVPGVDPVENVELTDELFGLLLRLNAEDALAVQKHLHPDYAMSRGMIEQIVKAPKSLMEHVVDSSNQINSACAPQEDTASALEHPQP